MRIINRNKDKQTFERSSYASAFKQLSGAAIFVASVTLAGCGAPYVKDQDNVVAATADILRTADGKPDLSGIWQTLSTADWDLEPHHARKDAPPGLGVVVGNVIPYQPWALEQKLKNFEKRAELDPRRKYFMPGIPRANYTPEPFQIFQSDKQLTFVYEFGQTVRTIHANGSKHPEGHIDWWIGDSRGHWEGDTLVVDVSHFNDQTWFDRSGNFHSDALHVVERYKPIGPDHIQYEAVIEDPKVFTKPWTISLTLYRHKEKDFQLLENYGFTFDYEKFYP
jgi:hypothetical protein